MSIILGVYQKAYMPLTSHDTRPCNQILQKM